LLNVLNPSCSEWPVTDAAFQKYKLSDEQLAAYERDGFIEGVKILNQAQVRLASVPAARRG
jgi:hypothetical protein